MLLWYKTIRGQRWFVKVHQKGKAAQRVEFVHCPTTATEFADQNAAERWLRGYRQVGKKYAQRAVEVLGLKTIEREQAVLDWVDPKRLVKKEELLV